MRSTGAVITEIIEAYSEHWGRWARIEEIATPAGLTQAELEAAITELLNDNAFRAEPQPFNRRITEWDRANAPIIGGEARHIIRWE
jgi:hypothetical protein